MRRSLSVVTHSLLAAAAVFVVYLAHYAARAQSSTPSVSPVVDFPSLVGKSTEEMEDLFGEHTVSYYGSHLEWFCRCEEARRYKVGRELWVGYRKDRAVSFSYVLDPRTAPQKPEPKTPEEMLSTVGLDVRGVPPSRTVWGATAGASGGPFGDLLGGKDNYLLWTGEVSGVDWNFVLVGGSEVRGSGSLLRPKNWRTVKRKYFQVVAHAAEAL